MTDQKSLEKQLETRNRLLRAFHEDYLRSRQAEGWKTFTPAKPLWEPVAIRLAKALSASPSEHDAYPFATNTPANRQEEFESLIKAHRIHFRLTVFKSPHDSKTMLGCCAAVFRAHSLFLHVPKFLPEASQKELQSVIKVGGKGEKLCDIIKKASLDSKSKAMAMPKLGDENNPAAARFRDIFVYFTDMYGLILRRELTEVGCAIASYLGDFSGSAGMHHTEQTMQAQKKELGLHRIYDRDEALESILETAEHASSHIKVEAAKYLAQVLRCSPTEDDYHVFEIDLSGSPETTLSKSCEKLHKLIAQFPRRFKNPTYTSPENQTFYRGTKAAMVRLQHLLPRVPMPFSIEDAKELCIIIRSSKPDDFIEFLRKNHDSIHTRLTTSSAANSEQSMADLVSLTLGLEHCLCLLESGPQYSGGSRLNRTILNLLPKLFGIKHSNFGHSLKARREVLAQQHTET